MKKRNLDCKNGTALLVARGGGGQMVSVCTLYSDDPNSNPADIKVYFLAD